MAINPYKGGKCWSCKYCTDVGYYDEDLDSVYRRKCTHSGKDYLDSCTNYCSSYIWDGKDSDFNYTSRSVPSTSSYSSGSSYSSSSYSSGSTSGSSSDSSGCGKGCLIAVIIAALLIGGAFFLSRIDSGAEKKPQTSTTQVDTKEKTAVIKHTGNVNLRKKATSKSGIITSMPPKSKVTVLKEKKSWAYIEYEGKKGWCFKKYLDFQD